jgi:hypothetical protein
MVRRRALSGLVAVALLMLLAPAAMAREAGEATGAAAGTSTRRGSVSAPARVLEIFFTNPTLVRAGEPVSMPVQVVCATADGRTCPATVTVGTRVRGASDWELTTAPAAPDLRFDLTAPASFALAKGAASGAVEFFIEARDTAGAITSVPPSGRSHPLAFYVARTIPVVRFTATSFGRVRDGRCVLSLPWGSGPLRAGLQPGREAQTLGPSGFSVGRDGRIAILDTFQDRLAAFHDGSLVSQRATATPPRALIAGDGVGNDVTMEASGPSLLVRSAGLVGMLRGSSLRPTQIVADARIVEGRAFAFLLPRDQWVPVTGANGEPISGAQSGATGMVGMPILGGRQLIRSAREDRIRMATLGPEGLGAAVELRASTHIGELALAEPDGMGGFVVVAHLWRETPTRADQYQVLDVRGSRVRMTFGVANRSFADTPPLARFRLGADGALYQMVTTSAGMSVMRFDLKEER